MTTSIDQLRPLVDQIVAFPIQDLDLFPQVQEGFLTCGVVGVLLLDYFPGYTGNNTKPFLFISHTLLDSCVCIFLAVEVPFMIPKYSLEYAC